MTDCQHKWRQDFPIVEVCAKCHKPKEVTELEAKVEALEEGIQSAIDCGMVPVSSAIEGGAAKYSEQVRVADRLRALLAGGKR